MVLNFHAYNRFFQIICAHLKPTQLQIIHIPAELKAGRNQRLIREKVYMQCSGKSVLFSACFPNNAQSTWPQQLLWRGSAQHGSLQAAAPAAPLALCSP